MENESTENNDDDFVARRRLEARSVPEFLEQCQGAMRLRRRSYRTEDTWPMEHPLP